MYIGVRLGPQSWQLSASIGLASQGEALVADPGAPGRKRACFQPSPSPVARFNAYGPMPSGHIQLAQRAISDMITVKSPRWSRAQRHLGNPSLCPFRRGNRRQLQPAGKVIRAAQAARAAGRWTWHDEKGHQGRLAGGRAGLRVQEHRRPRLSGDAWRDISE